MKLKFFLCISLLLFCLTGCATQFLEKDSETLSEGAYATKDSISVGRIDLAAKYADGVCQIVPPPKTPIVIKPLISSNKTAPKQETVLPSNLQFDNVIFVDSPEYKSLLCTNDSLKESLSQEQSYSKSVLAQVEKDKEVQSALLKDDEAQKATIAAYKKSIFYQAYEWYIFLGWFGPISAILLFAGVIALCVFFPPAIPIVLAIVTDIFNVIVGFFKWLISKL